MIRCPWANGSTDYMEYHDTEWGVELHGDNELFERLTLEAFQSGLSWLTILRKRDNFRRAFSGFIPERVAAYDSTDVDRLLADASIIRNKAKISAAIHNAQRILELDQPLDQLLWSFAPNPEQRHSPRSAADIPATTPESTAMARELKHRGFTFVGPTTCYALMQATGMVNDHIVTCFRAHTR